MKAEALQKVGRHGHLRLKFRERNGRTHLQDSFATMPMHALPPLYADETGCAFAYLVNPTGGFVGGDKVDIAVTLGEKSHVFLTAPSATRVYRSDRLPSLQTTSITIEEGGALEYMPGAIIPFADSRHQQSTTVHMGKHTKAFLLDAFTTGRVARGEHLSFSELQSSLRIEYDGDLILFERTALNPKASDYSGPGYLETFCVSAVVYLIFEKQEVEKPLAKALQAAVDGFESILGGVSSLWSRGLAVRLLGASTRHMDKAVYAVWSIARKSILDLDPAPEFSRLFP